MDIAVCVAPERAFDPGLRAHVSGVWANQKYKIETPNCLVIFKRQIRKTLLAGWGTDVSPSAAVRSREAMWMLMVWRPCLRACGSCLGRASSPVCLSVCSNASFGLELALSLLLLFTFGEPRAPEE